MVKRKDDKVFKKAEAKLYEYKDLKVEIESLEIENQILESEILECKSFSYKEDVVCSSNDNTELIDLIIKKEDKINSNKNKILRKSKQIEKIDKAISTLSDIDKNIVKLRYFENNTWRGISNSVGYAEITCKKKRVSIINRIKKII